jgi:hypothetical protein
MRPDCGTLGTRGGTTMSERPFIIASPPLLDRTSGTRQRRANPSPSRPHSHRSAPFSPIPFPFLNLWTTTICTSCNGAAPVCPLHSVLTTNLQLLTNFPDISHTSIFLIHDTFGIVLTCTSTHSGRHFRRCTYFLGTCTVLKLPPRSSRMA